MPAPGHGSSERACGRVVSPVPAPLVARFVPPVPVDEPAALVASVARAVDPPATLPVPADAPVVPDDPLAPAREECRPPDRSRDRVDERFDVDREDDSPDGDREDVFEEERDEVFEDEREDAFEEEREDDVPDVRLDVEVFEEDPVDERRAEVEDDGPLEAVRDEELLDAVPDDGPVLAVPRDDRPDPDREDVPVDVLVPSVVSSGDPSVSSVENCSGDGMPLVRFATYVS